VSGRSRKREVLAIFIFVNKVDFADNAGMATTALLTNNLETLNRGTSDRTIPQGNVTLE
jgi:hypothetical protein